jgi:hypothetical protein
MRKRVGVKSEKYQCLQCKVTINSSIDGKNIRNERINVDKEELAKL